MRPARPKVNRNLALGVGLAVSACLVAAGCGDGSAEIAGPQAQESPATQAGPADQGSPESQPSQEPSADPNASPNADTNTDPSTAPSASAQGTQGTDTDGTEASPQASSSNPADPSATATQELPRGGTELFPRYRLVGYSGGAAEAFGRLGVGDMQARVDEIEKLGKKYDGDGREAQPVLELIATVVQASPGKDKMHRARTSDAEIGRYLKVARQNKALLLLNIQPGRADFLTEVKAMSRWLEEPDVGLALDPEWAVGKKETPGRVYGHTSAAELNQVSLWLDEFVAEKQLPQKPFIVHQLASRIISDVPELRPRKNLAFVISVDGIGARKDKEDTWRTLVKPLPEGIHTGFKLFFEEDREHGKLMTPEQVLKLKPRPGYVLYE
ncbi:RodZ family helix-turn-helix domain-containing protein [Kineosporia babensis]|uniref:Lipoprotein n=1 Tax=Kineosporia babensis TaxID=499548 RepID=A0A9X1NI52_9ACTN|nr:hypothetical protein [Kineosporia babensis]MCD5314573.1 hypothetical protein [Kineosporia babensis]